MCYAKAHTHSSSAHFQSHLISSQSSSSSWRALLITLATSARGGSKEGFVRCRRRTDDVAGAFVEVRTTLFVCLIEYYYYYYYEYVYEKQSPRQIRHIYYPLLNTHPTHTEKPMSKHRAAGIFAWLSARARAHDMFMCGDGWRIKATSLYSI